MDEILITLQQHAGELLSAVILLIVFFLIARVARARQSVALAFALMPLFAVLAIGGQLV